MVKAPAATAVVFLIAVGLFLPVAGSQSLGERLADVKFPLLVVTVSPKVVLLQAERASVSGSTATDLRKCIDDTNCPDSALAAAGRGDSDGTVEQAEVDAFEAAIVLGLNYGSGEIADLRTALRQLVTIDGEAAASLQFREVKLDQALGPVTSGDPILMSLRVDADFPDVGSAKSHTVQILREESDLDVANRITIQPGSGWALPQSSIEPASVRSHYVDGRITGTLTELSGAEPMQFRIEQKPAGLPGWVWLLGVPVILLLAGGAVWYYMAQRRKG